MPDASETRQMDAAGVAAAVACCAMWGGNALAVKYAVPAIPPVGCAAARFALALPAVALACRWTGRPVWPRGGHWGLILGHAILAALQIGAFNWGTGLGEAGRSSIYINVHPLLIAPLAWVLLGERFGGRGLAGLLAAAAGVAVMLGEKFAAGGGVAADLIVLAAGGLFAVQTIAQKLTFPVIPPTTLLFAQSAIAFPIALAFSLAVEGPGAYHPTASAASGVIYQGVVVSGVCFAAWFVLLGRYPAGRLAALGFLTPLFGVAFGAIARGEPITVPLVIGGGLVALGVTLVASDKVGTAR